LLVVIEEFLGVPQAGITRWGSHLRQYQKLLASKKEISKVVNDPEAENYVSETLREYSLDRSFWSDLEELVDAIKDIVERITELESDGVISDVFKVLSI
jgi:hypothetical protein